MVNLSCFCQIINLLILALKKGQFVGFSSFYQYPTRFLKTHSVDWIFSLETIPTNLFCGFQFWVQCARLTPTPPLGCWPPTTVRTSMEPRFGSFLSLQPGSKFLNLKRKITFGWIHWKLSFAWFCIFVPWIQCWKIMFPLDDEICWILARIWI